MNYSATNFTIKFPKVYICPTKAFSHDQVAILDTGADLGDIKINVE